MTAISAPRIFTYVFALFVFCMTVMPQSASAQINRSPDESVTFPTTDGLTITADIYKPDEAVTPKTVIVLFHQAGSSRGEYRDIAPRLAEMGYIAMAADLRSGNLNAGVPNKTAELARKKQIPVDFRAAYPDIVSSLVYARRDLGAERLILWGSSYSASLTLLAAAQSSSEAQQTGVHAVDGVMAFSPGEYFQYQPTVQDAVKFIAIPTFMTSARDEFGEWRQIAQAVPDPARNVYQPTGMGSHGSSTLGSRDKEEYWKAVASFLKQYFPVSEN